MANETEGLSTYPANLQPVNLPTPRRRGHPLSVDSFPVTSLEQSTTQREQENSERLTELKYFVEQLTTQFLLPVTLCLAFVVVTIFPSNVYFTNGGAVSFYTPFYEISRDNWIQFWSAVANCCILLLFYGAVTLLYIFLSKKCKWITQGWIFLSTILILFFYSLLYMRELLQVSHTPVDFITIGVMLWNFGAVGFICIHGNGPQLLKKAYLIYLAALLGLYFVKNVPQLTAWVWLGLWCLIDLVRSVVRIYRKSEKPVLSGLLISSIKLSGGSEDSNISYETMNASTTEEPPTGLESLEINSVTNLVSANIEGKPELNLGMDAFFLYSILVGKVASAGDWNNVMASILGVLMGVIISVVIYFLFKKPTPMLPIPILLGMALHFVTDQYGNPFSLELTREQIFL